MKEHVLDSECDMNGTQQKATYDFGGKTQMAKTT
jgi:hypothetical protein